MKLLGSERAGHRSHHWWLHTDPYGNDQITVETVEDAEPVIEQVRRLTESDTKDFRFKASVPQTVVDECCRVYAKKWGRKPRDVLAELLRARTGRSKRVWKMLTEGRDHRKLQAKSWR